MQCNSSFCNGTVREVSFFKADASASFNALKRSLSLMEIIPDEILTLILGYACRCLGHDDSIHFFRDRLSRVSRRWRQLILQTPSFWTVLYLSPSAFPADLPVFLENHLERSKQYPLDIHLQCFWNPKTTHIIFDRIIPHSKRWRRLVIRTPTDDILSYLNNVPGSSLEVAELYYFSRETTLQLPTFSMTNLSSLSSLFLRNISLGVMDRIPLQLKKFDLRGNTIWSAFHALSDVLNGLPSLEDLTIYLRPTNVLEHTELQHVHMAPISLPALCHCRIVTPEGLSARVSELIRHLYCPNLVSMEIQDIGVESETLMLFTKSSNSRHTLTSNVMQCPPKLYVHSSNLYLAWASLMPIPALAVLELNAPQWPTHDKLEELISSLPTLETLVLREFQASSALQDIGVGPTIVIPSLQTLDVEFKHSIDSEEHHISQFLRIFSLSDLQSLRLRNLRAKEWENLLYCSYYPSLRSLVLYDMKDFISSAADPTLAFPLLTNLHLINVHSNDFMQRLLKERGTVCSGWPELQMLRIQGDNLISRPLLHRIAEFRNKMGLRIRKLVLERRFVNEDSRAWLDHHSCVEYTSL